MPTEIVNLKAFFIFGTYENSFYNPIICTGHLDFLLCRFRTNCCNNFNITMTLEKAIEIAVKAHHGQVDKYGAPYISHVTRVMNMGRTEEEKICGVLHDVVEDTSWTFDQLAAEGFSSCIIEALRCITKISENEDYEHFIQRTLQNRLACIVKLNDLTDNMDIKRIPEVTENDIARLNKYLNAYRTISNALSQ
jgi:(p)ppGpp synthase/HD superfamily hydrolase